MVRYRSVEASNRPTERLIVPCAYPHLLLSQRSLTVAPPPDDRHVSVAVESGRKADRVHRADKGEHQLRNLPRRAAPHNSGDKGGAFGSRGGNIEQRGAGSMILVAI